MTPSGNAPEQAIDDQLGADRAVLPHSFFFGFALLPLLYPFRAILPSRFIADGAPFPT